jgi:hypothetical protein
MAVEETPNSGLLAGLHGATSAVASRSLSDESTPVTLGRTDAFAGYLLAVAVALE